MNKPKPKFCVGEEVMIRSSISTSRNVDRTEILRMKYGSGYEITNRDKIFHYWMYWTDSIEIPFGEPALRKLPPEDRTQWSDCEWMPRSDVINTQTIEIDD